jgi:hypothetical protein
VKYLDSSKTGEKNLVLQDNHPDVMVIDGKELKVAEARELRRDITAKPARWDKKFLVLLNMDRPHSSVVPTLLKIVEEPPPHFVVVITTDNIKMIPPTIPSRSLQLNVYTPTNDELRKILEEKSLDDTSTRVRLSSGDEEVSIKMDLAKVIEWEKEWVNFSSGTIPSPLTILSWSEYFSNSENDQTQIACWEALNHIALAKMERSLYWREMVFETNKLREIAKRGKSNKMQISSIMMHIYALAKTSVVRNT